MKHKKDSVNNSLKCKICGSNKVSLLFKNCFCLMLYCKTCGLIYRSPEVDEKSYLQAITEHYGKVDPSTLVASSRKKIYENLFPKIKDFKSKRARLLDIGCGFGYFLSIAKGKGWNCYGVEPAKKLAKMGTHHYNVNIEPKSFEETNYPDDYFDVVTLWNVLDEIREPMETLREIKRITTPGGVLFIRTPNVLFHLLAYQARHILSYIGWGRLIPKESFVFHTYTFSNRSLRKLLKRTQFINVSCLNSIPTSGDPYKTTVGERRIVAFKRIIYYIAWILYYLSFKRITLAPSIEVIAKKPKMG